MKHKILAPILASILFLATSPVALTQTTQVTSADVAQDWQQLRGLKQGKQILVELKPGLGEPVTGKFVSATGSKLTVSLDGFNFDVEQRDIQKVYRLKGRWSRSRMAKIGMGVGMLTGTFIGVGKSIENERRPNHISTERDQLPSVLGFFFGSLAGAGIGALLGGKRKVELLYEAK